MIEETKKIIVGIVVLAVIMQISLIFAQSTFINGVEDDVLGALESSEWISVVINLKSKDEKIISSIVSNLSTSEFKFKETLLRGDAFIGNSTDSHTAFINSTGDLCIEKGDCSDQSGSCNPMRNAFIVRNSSNYNMSYIDYDGELCLIGKLYENAL